MSAHNHKMHDDPFILLAVAQANFDRLHSAYLAHGHKLDPVKRVELRVYLQNANEEMILLRNALESAEG